MKRPNPTTPSRRRWWSLSLRALMLLVLVAGGLFGWRARQASIQRAAVARIREAGGAIAYGWQSPWGVLASFAASPSAPEWLRRVSNDELFRDVRRVTLIRSPLLQKEPSEVTVAAVAVLDRLEELNVYQPMTDAQVARLGTMPALQGATLMGTKLTAAGIASIATWPRLEWLDVAFEPAERARPVVAQVGAMKQLKRLVVYELRDATPADFRPLAGLGNLEYLALEPSPGEESVVESLAGLRRLTKLYLPNTKVTDEGLRRLTTLDRLQDLSIDGAAVTDEGLANVVRWPYIRRLSLINELTEMPVRVGVATDRGLAHLTGLDRLESLAISGCFTNAGLATLTRCPALTSLSLDGVQEAATVGGLRLLLATRSFRGLWLGGPGVRDDWASALAGQASLNVLSLSGPQLTDAALTPLATLGSLRNLSLKGCRITDGGLMALARGGCGVRYLTLRETAVTPAGVSAFRAACSACRVDYLPNPSRR